MKIGKIYIVSQNTVYSTIDKAVEIEIDRLKKEHAHDLDNQKTYYESIIGVSNNANLALLKENEEIKKDIIVSHEKNDLNMTNIDSLNNELEESKKIIKEQSRQLEVGQEKISKLLQLINGFRITLNKDIAMKIQLKNAINEKHIKVWKLVNLVNKLG